MELGSWAKPVNNRKRKAVDDTDFAIENVMNEGDTLDCDTKHIKTPKINIITKNVAAAFDRTSTSSRSAEIILSALIADKHLKHEDKSCYAVSHNNISLSRQSQRKSLAQEPKNCKFKDWRNDVLNFCLSHLNEKQTRGDYEELLELTVIFLGGKPRKGIRFRKPGCLSRARWMARAIYSMKMFMLKGFHKYMADLSFLTHLENVTLFIAQFYVRFWFQTANAPAAPRLDLSLFKDISAFHDDKYINAARKTIKNHLWYLSQVNVALAFFDPGVDAEEKTEMVRALKHHSTRRKHSKMTSSYKASQINDNSTLKDFIGAETSCFFEILKLNRSFMDTTTPAEWSTNPEYQEAAERVKGLNVVNDVAERAVKLITDYHDKITTDSEQQQYLTQVIEWHRQRHPLKK
ncbi:conserved hypothetical protein [Culex quinquefasciatus]|uniref:Uncharacterized protein n=1 Tax=Culex quinquefasciatus TaxID=7176 RepID=B0WC37_CULQU|nr:conserved hypothetical protein [Culex quinquefasciatus]|eukprot:XP_001846271.1 conserved hypothetical protein [Culex quinquefasciatus]